MNTLIFGSQGQLGGALYKEVPAARRLDRTRCDVTDPTAVADAISAGTEVVFNATAYNQVDKAEAERDAVFAVNAYAPGVLAAAAREVSARFVHYSTDYVFGNGHGYPIDESTQPAPLSAYGRSKAHGETLAMQNNPDTVVIRTTGLYSERRDNFVKTMIKFGVAGRRLTVVSDQFVSPTWVDSVARVSIEIAQSAPRGVYHVTAQGGCSWFEFAARIFEILDIKADLHPVDQETYGAAAARPQYSVLDDAMLRAARLTRVGRWDDELESFLGRHGASLVQAAESA